MNYLPFRNLLKKAKGPDSLEYFVLKSGLPIAPLFEDETISRPSIETLKKIVIASRGRVTLRELKASLEYYNPYVYKKAPVKEHVKIIEEALVKVLEELSDIAPLWESPEALLSTLTAMCDLDGLKKISVADIHPLQSKEAILCKITYLARTEDSKKPYQIVEQNMRLFVSKVCSLIYLESWAFDPVAFFAAGWDVDKYTVREYRPSNDREIHDAAERLLKSIFGTKDEPYSTSVEGIGFYYSNNAFMDFLKNHQETVRDIAGDNLDFNHFSDSYGNGKGPGAVVATIMRVETGLPFGFWTDDVFNEGKPCILLDGEFPSEEYNRIVAKYAAELEIREFGIRYVPIQLSKDLNAQFLTKDFV